MLNVGEVKVGSEVQDGSLDAEHSDSVQAYPRSGWWRLLRCIYMENHFYIVSASDTF